MGTHTVTMGTLMEVRMRMRMRTLGSRGSVA